jgi:2-polyprenyl-3-methyl-5-hydroxy-6-metoxy-1,4-benzoquinol methylase
MGVSIGNVLQIKPGRENSNTNMAARLEEVRAKVDWTLMPGDHMLSAPDLNHYSAVGESALNVMTSCLALAGAKEPQTILDFGCGSGRVLRWLRAAYPGASLHASDVRQDSLRFCATQFRATTWLSSANLADIEAPARFDLIWAGSVATHLSEERTQTLLRKLCSWLNNGGVSIVTTHGRKALRNMRARRTKYVPPERHEDVLFPLCERGYGYLPFQGRDVGFSVNTLEWLMREALALNVRIVCISEHAWDKHQDVLAVQRVA